MNGATLFSGIDAPEVSAPGIDWLWRAEIDKFANAVSEHHRPDTPNIGDVSAPDFVERALEHGRPDLIVFGSPCQSFSVAGKRLGLDDPRGNLALVALGVVGRLRPRWLVFENVPGLFSNYSGSEHAQSQVRKGDVGGYAHGEENRDFAAFLTRLRECGYLGCWRVYDAQFAGVPQRRRRIFFVGYLGDWRPAAAVLFERESLSWDSPPCRETRPPVVALTSNGVGTCGADDNQAQAGPLLPAMTTRTGTGTGRDGMDEYVVAHSLCGEGFDASEDGTGRGTPIVVEQNNMASTPELPSLRAHETPNYAVAFSCKDHGADAGDTAPTLRAMGHDGRHANAGGQVAVAINLRGREGGAMPEIDELASLRAADGGSSRSYIAGGMQVRRLTPVECERLQDYRDNYTRIPWRGKPAEQCPDGNRYRALGNSMAIPVIGWTLDRVQQFERLAA